MWEYILGLINDLSGYANSFNVNPVVFLVIYFGTTPFILVPVYFLGRIAAKKTDKKYFWPLMIVLILAIVAPYLYIVVFGQGINIFIKLVVIAIAIISLIRLLSKKLNIKPLSYLRAKIASAKKKKDE